LAQQTTEHFVNPALRLWALSFDQTSKGQLSLLPSAGCGVSTGQSTVMLGRWEIYPIRGLNTVIKGGTEIRDVGHSGPKKMLPYSCQRRIQLSCLTVFQNVRKLGIRSGIS